MTASSPISKAERLHGDAGERQPLADGARSLPQVRRFLFPPRSAGRRGKSAEHCIKKSAPWNGLELGMEAIWRIEVVDFPAFIVVDDKGNDFFKELNLG